ncbi:MAG TPA: hypothetical protein QGG47_03240 [Acidobacteriota bacterium]|nr:hypothetical protein [Acidobacteriota bacterium]
MNHPIHPDALELVAFVSDSLAAEDAHRLHTHCLVCDTCGSQARALLWLRAAAGRAVPSVGLGGAYTASGATH